MCGKNCFQTETQQHDAYQSYSIHGSEVRISWSIQYLRIMKQVVKVIWQKAPNGGPIPRLGVTPGGRKLYHWIPGVGFPISVP